MELYNVHACSGSVINHEEITQIKGDKNRDAKAGTDHQSLTHMALQLYKLLGKDKIK